MGGKNGPILLSTMASALWADRWLKPALRGTLVRSSQAPLGPSKGSSSSCPLPSQGLVFSKSTPQGCLRDAVPVRMAQGVLWDKDFKRLLPMAMSPGKHISLIIGSVASANALKLRFLSLSSFPSSSPCLFLSSPVSS